MIEFSQDTMGEAAFQLLASSTISRYAKEAIRIAKKSEVYRTIKAIPEPCIVGSVIDRARAALEKTEGRDINEILLVLYLAVLNEHDKYNPGTVTLFVEIANLKNPMIMWPASFARYLIAAPLDKYHEKT